MEIFYHIILLFVCVVPAKASEKKLLNHLLDGYSRFARPVLDCKNSVNVSFGFEMIHIVQITESTQTFQAKVWLRMSWKNELLTWEPSKWGTVSKTRLDAGSVWTPDIFLQEDISSDMSSGPDRYKTNIQLESDGTQTWNVPVLVFSSCIFDVTNFPFDHQNCTFRFMSWTHDQKELDVIISNTPIVTSNYINSSEWSLVGITHNKNVKKYNCCPNPYVDILYTIMLRRKPLYYFYYVVLPCIIQMMIILFTFFLPPDSGERIGVVITVLLVFAVYLEVLSNALPKSSSTTPALSRFYLAAMAESAFSIIATCFVLVIHFKGAEKGVGPMPAWVRELFIKQLSGILCIRRNLREHSDDELLALEKKDSSTSLDIVNNKHGVMDDNPINCNGVNDASINNLIKEVRVITELIHDQNLQDEIEEEWQILGKVFDRIFFFIFLFIFVVSSLIILLPVYQNHNNV